MYVCTYVCVCVTSVYVGGGLWGCVWGGGGLVGRELDSRFWISPFFINGGPSKKNRQNKKNRKTEMDNWDLWKRGWTAIFWGWLTFLLRKRKEDNPRHDDAVYHLSFLRGESRNIFIIKKTSFDGPSGFFDAILFLAFERAHSSCAIFQSLYFFCLIDLFPRFYVWRAGAGLPLLNELILDYGGPSIKACLEVVCK